MRYVLIFLLSGIVYCQTPLSREEKLDLENAALKLENLALKIQMLKLQEAEVQRQAQALFESVCKRAKIEVSSCQFDAKTQTVEKK